jgi:hypothetical protein
MKTIAEATAAQTQAMEAFTTLCQLCGLRGSQQGTLVCPFRGNLKHRCESTRAQHMKIVAACLLALCAVGCDAQTSRVTAAYSIYKSCIRGLMQAQNKPASHEQIHDTVIYSDQFCMAWTTAWYPALLSKEEFDLNSDELQRLDTYFRRPLLLQMETELIEYMTQK